MAEDITEQTVMDVMRQFPHDALDSTRVKALIGQTANQDRVTYLLGKLTRQGFLEKAGHARYRLKRNGGAA